MCRVTPVPSSSASQNGQKKTKSIGSNRSNKLFLHSAESFELDENGERPSTLAMTITASVIIGFLIMSELTFREIFSSYQVRSQIFLSKCVVILFVL